MGTSRALGLPSVQRRDLVKAFTEEGYEWDSLNHVTATLSLRRAFRSTGSLAHNLMTLIDLVVLPTLEGVPAVEDFPKAQTFATDPRAYGTAEKQWRAQCQGVNLSLSIEFDQILRDYLDNDEVEAAPEVRDLLRRERRTFRKTLQSLSAAGVLAADLESTSAEMGAIAQLGLRVWNALEQQSDLLASYRESLWIDVEEYRQQETPRSRAVRSRILDGLETAFGPVAGTRTVIHHGFYFFTPPQWAMFQLLELTPGVDQFFVIHDDGSNPAFEIWRRFFSQKWELPHIERRPSEIETSTPARELRRVLQGETAEVSEQPQDLRVLECKSPTDFARYWRRKAGKGIIAETCPPLFAPRDGDIRKILSAESGASRGATDLARLPVGAYLLAISRCIEVSSRGIKRSISRETVLDCASSGFTGARINEGELASTFLRAAPFFDGCRDPQDWRDRSTALRRLIASSPGTPRKQGESTIDTARALPTSPLRLAPWLDLSSEEAEEVERLIHHVARVVDRFAAVGRGSLNGHLSLIGSDLRQGLRNVSPDLQREVEAKIIGLSLNAGKDIDLEGLIDAISLLLGGEIAVDGLGEDEQAQDIVQPLRALDALGFQRSEVGVDLGNFADGLFPARSPTVGWPFTMADLGDGVRTITRELLETRWQTASTSDLYLLWLAADGVAQGSELVISWITHMPDGERTISGIIGLLLAPDHRFASIRELCGGIEVESPLGQGDLEVLGSSPVSSHNDGLLVVSERDVRAFGPIPLSSAMICARRFALQWVLGVTPSFQSDHQQSMLFGNMTGPLMKASRLSGKDVRALLNDSWRQLTQGQRASSMSKGRIKDDRRRMGTKPEWIFTLRGAQQGNRASDDAYRAALGEVEVPMNSVSAEKHDFLPRAPTTNEHCTMCPVQNHCAVRYRLMDQRQP